MYRTDPSTPSFFVPCDGDELCTKRKSHFKKKLLLPRAQKSLKHQRTPQDCLFARKQKPLDLAGLKPSGATGSFNPSPPIVHRVLSR